MHKIATALLISVLSSGCAREIWTGPQSAEGRNCVAQCLSGKQQCESINAAADRLANNQCQNEYNRQMRDYQQCEQQNRSSSAEDRCTQWDNDGKCQSYNFADPCTRPQSCSYSSTSNWRCQSNYRDCFLNCGGQIQEER